MVALFFTGSLVPQDLIPEGYSLQEEYCGKATRPAIVDTFDWRLWNAGFAAIESGEALELRDLDTWATEAGTGEKLQKIIYPRALIRRIEVSQQLEVSVIRNRDEKIVCRADMISLRLDNSKTAKAKGIVFHPLKGYEDETREIERHARLAVGKSQEDLPSNEVIRNGTDPLSLLLEREKDNPVTFLSHKSLRLESGVPLQEASRNLLLQFAEVMESCVPGILEDTDPEFLHDYRVCVRKSRAFLSLLKSLLETGAVSPHLSFLRGCGEMTTEMRDLDVYLLEFPHFYNVLPPSLNTHLEASYGEIQAKRAAAMGSLSARLGGRSYKTGFSSWRKYLKSGSLIAVGAGIDSDILGRRLIARKYRKVRKLASRITERTPDPDLHILRIECKKLRYCIEFFRSAVHEPIVDEVLSLLKTLQDVLGEFNDMSVQQQWLHDALQSQEVVRAPGVQAAIGGLMTSLYTKQQGLRRRIFEKFTGFVDESVASRIMELKVTLEGRY